MCDNQESRLDFCKTLYRNGISGHCEEHITIADYYPRIAEIVCCDARVYVTGYDLSGENLEIGGTADTYMIYIGDNGELVPLSRSIEFTEKLSVKDVPDDSPVIVTVIKDGVTVKGSGGHAEIKCAYRLEVCIIGNCTNEPQTSDDAQVKTISKTMLRLACSDAKNVYIEEDIDLSDSDESAKRLLFNNGSVTVDEWKIVTGKVIAKGTLHVNANYETLSGSLAEISRDIPFSRVFDCPNVTEAAKASCTMELADLRMELYDDNTGENRIIACEANVLCSVLVFEQQEGEIPVDAFSLSHDYDVKYQKYDCMTDINSECSTGRFSVPIQIEDNIKSIEAVIADAACDSAVSDENGTTVRGNITVNALMLDADGMLKNKTATAAYETVFEGSRDCKVLRASAEASGVTYNISSSGEMTVVGTVKICLMCARNEEIECVCEMVDKGTDIQKRNCITVYYPQDNEGWWDIAKRFHIEQEELCKSNGGGDKPQKAVLIPRK